MSFSHFKNNVSFEIALKPSLAGEGGVRRNQKHLFFNILSLLVFKAKKISKKEFILTPPHPNPLQQERA